MWGSALLWPAPNFYFQSGLAELGKINRLQAMGNTAKVIPGPSALSADEAGSDSQASDTMSASFRGMPSTTVDDSSISGAHPRSRSQKSK